MIQTPFKALGYLKKKQVLPFKKEREKKSPLYKLHQIRFLVCVKGFASVLGRKANPVLTCAEKRLAQTSSSFFKSSEVPTEGGSPQGGQEAGDQQPLPWGRPSNCGWRDVNPCPVHGPRGKVWEKLLHQSSRKCYGKPRHPTGAQAWHSHVKNSTGGLTRGLGAGGPAETESIRTRSQQPTNQSQLSFWHKMIYKSSWQVSRPRAIFKTITMV